jgi:hypothetical protein
MESVASFQPGSKMAHYWQPEWLSPLRGQKIRSAKRRKDSDADCTDRCSQPMQFACDIC